MGKEITIKLNNMKPFDLEKALAGEPVCTRDGRPVKIAGYNPDAQKRYVLLCWVEDQGRAYNIDGICNVFCSSGKDDLFMAPKPKVKREGWVNVFMKNGQYFVSGIVHDTLDNADLPINKVATAKIEWEEESE